VFMEWSKYVTRVTWKCPNGPIAKTVSAYWVVKHNQVGMNHSWKLGMCSNIKNMI